MSLARSAMLLLVPLFLAAGCAASHEAHSALQDSERIVFFGDSITEQGAQPGGYVSLIADSLTAQYPSSDIQVIGAGVSGNKVSDLQARLDRDVLARNPTAVVIYIGINDVWHWAMAEHQGTTKEAYESGLRSIIGTLQQRGARVILCTPTVIGEKHNGLNPQDQMLDEYAAISRSVARDMEVQLCDLHADFIQYLKTHNPENLDKGILTVDGVHLNDTGNAFVAHQMLQALEHQD